MKPITKNSIIAVSVISVVYIFNLIRPDQIIYAIAAAVVMVVICAKYLFDTSISRSSIVADAKFLLMPLLFNISALSYISYIYVGLGRFLLTFLAIVSNFYLFTSLRKLRNLGEKAAIFYRNILVVISFFTVFMASSMTFRLFMTVTDKNLLDVYRAIVVVAIFALIYFVTYFLTWEKGALETKDRAYGLISAFLCAEVVWITSIWLINYPVIGITEKAALGGTPIAAIVVTITYYFLWGMISHKLDNNLTRKVLTEYLTFTILFLLVLFVTAKWLPTG